VNGPIDRYLEALGRRLAMPEAARAAALEEARGHLLERAASYVERGIAQGEAERIAVALFGDARRVGERLSRVFGVPWGWRRFLAGTVLGAGMAWLLWTAGSFPLLVYTFYASALPGSPPPDVGNLLIQSTPLTEGGFYAYLTAGWLWLLPLLALYLTLPCWWGRRAWRWWLPGAAYGLGGWLAVFWFPFFAFRFDGSGFAAEARLVLLALPLALLASWAGWLSRRGMRPRLDAAPAGV
jgi:hypothetical protein